MLKLQKSSLVLILIIVVLTAGCVSIYTLGYTPGTVWHKAEDVKAGTFGQNVGNGNYNFPGNLGIKKTNPTLELDVTGNIYATDQVIAGTKFVIGGSSLTGTALTVASGGTSSIGGNLNITGNVGVGTTSPQVKLDVNGAIKIGTEDICNADTEGALRYDPCLQQFEGCNGSTWVLVKAISATPPPPLSSACGTVTFTYRGSQVTYGTVLGANGRCWLDRNLGARRVAIAYNDSCAYGDLFQWGRLADGHQVRTSGTTTTLSSADVPGHSNFIVNPNIPNDWRSTWNDNLWQGVDGINNPCPAGWRIPTDSELWQEIGGSTVYTAFAGPLKIPAAGYRTAATGQLASVGEEGYYWTSTAAGLSGARRVHLRSDGSSLASPNGRASGFSVRCIKN